MTAPAAPQQMPLGQVPVGWLATTNAADPAAPVYKIAAKSPAGVLTGHPYGDATAQFTVSEAHELAATVYAMPDPNEPAQTAPSVTPAQGLANVQQAFPQATQIGTSSAASSAPAQQVPDAGQAAALSPLVRATLALFDANTMPAVAGAPELAEAFKTAAFAVGRGPRGARTIEALNRLLDARSMAALALFEPNA